MNSNLGEEEFIDFLYATKLSSTELIEYVKLNIENGLDIQYKTTNGWSFLHYAVMLGNVKLAQYFIDSGIDVNNADKHNWTPVIVAINNNKIDTLKVLLNNNADISKNFQAEQVLDFISKQGYIDIAKILIEKGIDMNMKNDELDTPLHTAIKCHNSDMAKYLIDECTDLNIQNNLGWTPLYTAIEFGEQEVAKYLVFKGANEKVVTKMGNVVTL